MATTKSEVVVYDEKSPIEQTITTKVDEAVNLAHDEVSR